MGRLIAFILGGAALTLYVPALIPGDISNSVEEFWKNLLVDWYEPVFQAGPGIFAGLALILLAIRDKD